MQLSDLEKIDTKKMYKEYDRWPEIAQNSFEEKFEKFDTSDIDHIVFAGMGGSGTVGDTISAILSKKDIHVSIVKGYLIPKTVDSKTLVIVTSVSGNTRETLAVLEKAQKTDAKIAAFSSGGILQRFCESKNVFFKEINLYNFILFCFN